MLTLWLPTAMSNLTLLLVLFAVLLQSQLRLRLVQVMKHPLIWGAVILWLMLGLTSFYSIAPIDDDLSRWLKYKEFLWLPLFAALCRNDQDKHQALVGFLLGATLVLSLSYAVHFGLISLLSESLQAKLSPGPDDGPVIFKMAITYNFMMALAACTFVVAGLKYKQYRWILWILAGLAIFNVLALVNGRTGYLVLIAAFVYLFFARFGYKGLLLGTIAVIPVSLLIYNLAPKLQVAVDEGLYEVKRWINEPLTAQPTGSMEMRLNWWLASSEAIVENPLFGYGIGGYEHAYANLRDLTEYIPNVNPHNQALLFAVEAGLIWLGLFLVWWLALWWYSDQKSRGNKDGDGHHYFQIYQIAWLSIGLGCMFNSFFLDHTEGILIQAFAGLFLLGGVNQDNTKPVLD